jgi:hypothetical protein
MKKPHRDEAPVPESTTEAAAALRTVLKQRRHLPELETGTFLEGWASLSYLAPGLHPDDYENPQGGWPAGWKPLAAEAFRRSARAELADGELYPARAALAGLGIHPDLPN